MGFANAQVSDLLATTIAARSRKLADNLEHNNALLAKLRQRGNVRTFSGGTHIMEEIMYDDGDTSSGSYSGYDVIDITPDSPISAAEYDIKQYARAVTISGLELIQNAGREQMIDLLAGRVQVAEARLRNAISAGLYGDGTGNGGKDITGLQAAISSTPNTGTYGGIDRGTWAFWRNQVISCTSDVGAAMSPATIQSAMNKLALACARGTDRVDLIVADNEAFEAYQSSLQAIQRVTNDSGQGTAGAGFTSLKYHGAGANADVIFDGGIGGNMPAKTMYFLNTSFIFFRPHRQRNFVPLGNDRQSVNQDAVTRLIGWAGNLTTSGAQFQGILVD
ncbi:phage major capsid protein [Bordetella bronchiseptica]|uniref:phage major capsid protein n=1 Tax=Bordetella bronchiseptica TaxID=518 RepID=UPI000460D778|nr:phage major capsid protein [Bordetella bronchiseptica]AZW14218.1 phage major capsid protein [Bordetella bronchiseptica]KDC48047.1 hypothetical protein L509_4150 [Bordetella bronchiseptica M85/00/2]QBS70754.1 3-phosphoglycerate kinase [Bordetella bronchiseptica]